VAAAPIGPAAAAPAATAPPATGQASKPRSADAAPRDEPAVPISVLLRWKSLLAEWGIGRRAAIASMVVVTSLVVGAIWMFHSPAQSPDLAQAAPPVGNMLLTPSAPGAAIGNQANQAAPAKQQGGTSLITGTVPLVNGGTSLLVRPTK
jgi:hypothetical protein